MEFSEKPKPGIEQNRATSWLCAVLACTILNGLFCGYVFLGRNEVKPLSQFQIWQNSQTVRVQFNNEKTLPFQLLRVAGDELFDTQITVEGASQTIVLSTGIYVAKSFADLPTAISVPVPAIKVNHAPDLHNKQDHPDLVIGLQFAPPKENGWCFIPAGPTIFGDNIGVGQEDERPVQVVDIPAFWLAAYEVTNEQYAQFLTARGVFDDSWIDMESRKCRIQKADPGTYVSDAPQLPVVMISLAGAQAYCDWLSTIEDQSCRLPTEIEWEKAARGPESFVYAYGNTYRQYGANQESGILIPVGKFGANGFGLYDMTGNAFEWVSGKYDPTRTSDQLQGMTHVLRGGSFVLDGMYLRNSFRMRQSPTVMTDDIGFRVARDAKNADSIEQGFIEN